MTDKRKIIDEITVEQLLSLQKSIDKYGDSVLVVKFTANWCRPCQTIKQLTLECFANLPKNVIIAEVDIDDNMDIYMFMKKHRIVNGIPAILVWYPCSSRDLDRWYIPDDSVSGSDQKAIFELFGRCNTKALNMLP